MQAPTNSLDDNLKKLKKELDEFKISIDKFFNSYSKIEEDIKHRQKSIDVLLASFVPK